MLRPALANDLEIIASWIQSPRDCLYWAGAALKYPLQLNTLSSDINFSSDTSFSMEIDHSLVAFGQLTQKSDGRGHISKIIVAPESRGKGYGKALVMNLLNIATHRNFHPVGLWVDPNNHIALKMYGDIGFFPAELPTSMLASPGSLYLVCK